MAFGKDDIVRALAALAPARVGRVAWCDGHASMVLEAGGLGPDERRQLRARAEALVRGAADRAGATLHAVHVELVEPGPAPGSPGPAASQASRATTGSGGAGNAPGPAAGTRSAGTVTLPGEPAIIAVGAGKGGVGKSTLAVNLAVGLSRLGHAVGLLDADIYGPSLPTMLGLWGIDPVVIEGHIQPFLVHGVKAVTIGRLVDPDKPLIWRGPMAHSAFKQLVEQTRWGELDYLIIDLPPGTGDVALTMAQTLSLTGAVVVCTPQRVAQDDAGRAVRMFQQLGIPILGVVENMSFFVGDDGKEYDLFGKGGAQQMAARLNVPFLGTVPITTALRTNSDSGEPLANFVPATAGGPQLPLALQSVVTAVLGQAALAQVRSGARRPALKIS